MAIRKILIFVAFAALVYSSEVEDSEQKKRGAGKTSSLNSIPTGAQKTEYTYSIYPQSSSSQSNQPSPSYQPSASYQPSPSYQPTPSYQPQFPNSFYPSQGASQYYSSPNPPDSSSYPAQPQINLIPPSSTSQFVPINFIPNPGYQTKYQIVPSKSQNGNIQIAYIPQPQGLPSPYQHLFSPNFAHQINSQQGPLISSVSSQGHYNIAPNYQSLSFGSSYVGQPSTTLLFAQPNPSLFNNLLYSNPVQSLYNYPANSYYPTNTQTKYASYASSPSSGEYEKLQGPTGSITKEDNDILSSSHNGEYITPSESNNYKNTYTSSRSSYSKI